MKKFRPSNLVKFLNEIRQPFFLLDNESTLLFCNKALEDWTGCTAEQLIGLRLRYRAASSRLKHEIAAAALAPPPEVFQGKRCRNILTIDRITTSSRRVADFIPLLPNGILVLVDANEVASTDAGTTNLESSDSRFPDYWQEQQSLERRTAAELHQTLLGFRRRQAGRYRWDRMIGSSQAMQRIRRLGRLAVETSATVLIVGEIGSGREHFASAIHYGQIGETVGALVPVECGVLNPDLIASTLLAFRKRFQSDKSNRRHTLLLKDAEALSDSFLPIIGDFVAATSPNQRLIATSILPPESWPNHPSIPILLGTLQIDLPPLRERKEDIPLLAQMFLEEQNEQADRQRAGFTAEAFDMILQYDWPGNLDELESLVGQAHAVGSGALIAASNLPERIQNAQDASRHEKKDEQPIDLEAVLREIETDLIRRALLLARNNKTKAAELLGLTRPKLYRRLEMLGESDIDD